MLINLGDNTRRYGPYESDYMDEFMSEGAPHLRALYARLPPASHAVGDLVGELAGAARRLILGGFEMPVPEGINLSPTTTLAKAYAHLTLANPSTGLSGYTPWREKVRCMNLRAPPLFTHHVDPTSDPPDSRCNATQPCLLAALGEDFNRRVPPAGLAWFHEGWDETWAMLRERVRPMLLLAVGKRAGAKGGRPPSRQGGRPPRKGAGRPRGSAEGGV